MDIKILDFNRGDNDVENKTRILYNDTVDQWKGCSAAWQRVCFGYKMSQVQILSSLPITAPLSSNEGFFEINSHWTQFTLDISYRICHCYDTIQCMHRRCIGANPFLYSLIFYDKKALLVQFGRTWVSKTRCRRFKSYRA